MEAPGLARRDIRLERSEPAGLAIARRCLDVLAATVLILVSLPLMLAVAFAIRVDSRGPVLFRQRRVGRGEAEFTLLKFRSMRVDADPDTHRDYVANLIHEAGDGQPAPDGNGLYKLAVDDRITPVGRLIRKWSADELPQLFNVLAGQMSLVGPRPVTPYEVAEFPAWYRRRFAVKPGLTGLWQVSGRSERSYEEMVRLDVEYAESRTALGDLAIVAKTPWVVLSRRGAR